MIETQRTNDETKKATQEGPFWYVYRCVASSEVRGSNRLGTPCGQPQMLRRRERIEWPRKGANRVQAKCPECGNRPRLTPATVTQCRDRDHAEHVKRVLTEEGY